MSKKSLQGLHRALIGLSAFLSPCQWTCFQITGAFNRINCNSDPCHKAYCDREQGRTETEKQNWE